MSHYACHNIAPINMPTLRCFVKRGARILTSVQPDLLKLPLAYVSLLSLPRIHHAVTASILIDDEDANL